MLRTRD